MKTPIEVKDIRKGDLIRKEFTSEQQKVLTAAEYVAERDGHHWIGADATYYLLDRPTPPVELPTEPTLGWATWDKKYLAVWKRRGQDLVPTDSRGDFSGKADGVVEFVNAVAVPAVALDELRAFAAQKYELAPTSPAHFRIEKFLMAVDAANGDRA